MEFKDYAKEELIGKTVLYFSGYTYSSKSKYIATITKVTKTGFRIDKSNNLFGFDGKAKGFNSKMDMGTISECFLITEEHAKSLITKWAANKIAKTQKKELLDSIQSLTNEQTAKLYESLKQITQP